MVPLTSGTPLYLWCPLVLQACADGVAEADGDGEARVRLPEVQDLETAGHGPLAAEPMSLDEPSMGGGSPSETDAAEETPS